jgi:hypothetical protein
MNFLAQEVRFCLRQLKQAPPFTANYFSGRFQITGSRQREQATPKPIGVGIFEQRLYLPVGVLPNRHRRCEQSFARRGQAQPAATAVGGIFGDRDQAAPLQRLECGGEGSAIHGEQSCDGRESGRLGTIERHHERELAVSQTNGAQCFIKAARQCARSPLHVEAETAVAHTQSRFERNVSDP